MAIATPKGTDAGARAVHSSNETWYIQLLKKVFAPLVPTNFYLLWPLIRSTQVNTFTT